MLVRTVHFDSASESAISDIVQHVYVSELVFKRDGPRLLELRCSIDVPSPTAPRNSGTSTYGPQFDCLAETFNPHVVILTNAQFQSAAGTELGMKRRQCMQPWD